MTGEASRDLPGVMRRCNVWLAVSGLGPRMAGCHLAADHTGPHQHRRTVGSLVEGAPPATEVIQWWTEQSDESERQS